MEDTIAAIATAQGIGAISIIRVSGPNAIEIVNKIFKEKDLTKVETHTIHYGKIYNQEKIIDEVLVTIMKAPKSFTTEDVVEINCHGGIITTKEVLELLLFHGARLAEPGEFTKRAFLNGRIDLLQAEGVMDLISSKTESSRELAMNQLSGKTKNLIQKIRSNLTDILTSIEVNIDYPEYEENIEITNSILKPKIKKIKEKMQKLLEVSENGQIIKTGITTCIIGRPNVGKSSLLNALLEEEKAIVTDIEGTTRDIVEGSILLDGFLINIIDTAGIRQTKDIVESIGVEKSLDLIDKSDLILFMLNNNDKLTEQDKEILKKIKNKKHIIIINKMDLDSHLKIDFLNKENIVYLSIKENKGLDDLKNKIKQLFETSIDMKDLTYLTNARSISLLRQACQKMDEIELAIKENVPVDMVEIDIKEVWNKLGEIIGETYEEELIDELFSHFCLGK
jgi:tRNA modification GTPase